MLKFIGESVASIRGHASKQISAALLFFSLPVMSGCAEPLSILRHPHTKQVWRCSGQDSAVDWGGRRAHDRCVEDMKKQGFEVISTEHRSSAPGAK
jgi:hypothetical protein